ncbi:MAG: hypothetical protein ABSC72_03040 [Methylovirgula sp.]
MAAAATFGAQLAALSSTAQVLFFSGFALFKRMAPGSVAFARTSAGGQTIRAMGKVGRPRRADVIMIKIDQDCHGDEAIFIETQSHVSDPCISPSGSDRMRKAF